LAPLGFTQLCQLPLCVLVLHMCVFKVSPQGLHHGLPLRHAASQACNGAITLRLRASLTIAVPCDSSSNGACLRLHVPHPGSCCSCACHSLQLSPGNIQCVTRGFQLLSDSSCLLYGLGFL
jgi:hypothetical protein